MLRRSGHDASQYPSEYSIIHRLAANLKAPVIVDAKWIEALLGAGGTPYVNDPWLYLILTENGRIDRRARRPGFGKWEPSRNFSFRFRLEIHEQMHYWSKPMLRAMSENFTLESASKELYAYTWRPRVNLKKGDPIKPIK